MKAISTVVSTLDELEDTLYNPDLVVVQKDTTTHLNHLQAVYVYETVESKKPMYGIFREITLFGTEYYKEIY